MKTSQTEVVEVCTARMSTTTRKAGPVTTKSANTYKLLTPHEVIGQELDIKSK